MATPEMLYCETCRKTMNSNQFYFSNNSEKYPDGKLKKCKKCISMHVDNWNPDTYTWILQECDVPYLPWEWDVLLTRYGKDKSKITGTTILGRYLSKVRLAQWNKFRWADSQFLQDQHEYEIEQAMKKSGCGAAEIAQEIAKSRMEIPTGQLEEPQYQEPQIDQSFVTEEEPDELENDLTEEDKVYLRLKWGHSYKASELVALEQLYRDMDESFPTETAADIDSLKFICKTSLKANQLIDLGD